METLAQELKFFADLVEKLNEEVWTLDVRSVASSIFALHSSLFVPRSSFPPLSLFTPFISRNLSHILFSSELERPPSASMVRTSSTQKKRR